MEKSLQISIRSSIQSEINGDCVMGSWRERAARECAELMLESAVCSESLWVIIGGDNRNRVEGLWGGLLAILGFMKISFGLCWKLDWNLLIWHEIFAFSIAKAEANQSELVQSLKLKLCRSLAFITSISFPSLRVNASDLPSVLRQTK